MLPGRKFKTVETIFSDKVSSLCSLFTDESKLQYSYISEAVISNGRLISFFTGKRSLWCRCWKLLACYSLYHTMSHIDYIWQLSLAQYGVSKISRQSLHTFPPKNNHVYLVWLFMIHSCSTFFCLSVAYRPTFFFKLAHVCKVSCSGLPQVFQIDDDYRHVSASCIVRTRRTEAPFQLIFSNQALVNQPFYVYY